MEKLFEPFFRGDVRDSRQGLGLGLHIASQIAQAHGGRLAVSFHFRRNTFHFYYAASSLMCMKPLDVRRDEMDYVS